MIRGVFQATIVDENGSIVPSASIAVVAESDGSSPSLFDAITAGNSLGNPFTAAADGLARFYVNAGTYRITATLGALSREWRHVHVCPLLSGSFTGTLTGMSASTTGTVQWRVTGQKATLFITAAITGTSNAATMTMTGLPATLTPTTNQIISIGQLVTSASAQTIGDAEIRTDSTIVFRVGRTDLAANYLVVSSADFPTSGTKGLGANWSVTYDLS